MGEILKVGIVQQSCVAEKQANRRKLRNSVLACVAKGAELIVLQELHDSLYFCQTENPAMFDLAEPFPGEATQFYSSLALECGAVIVTSLFEKRLQAFFRQLCEQLSKEASGSILKRGVCKIAVHGESL